LNPPYGGIAGEFVAKLAVEYKSRNVTAAIALVSAHSTDTNWFKPLWDGLLCFTDHRIQFSGENNVGGSVFVYFGDDRKKFLDIFERFGCVVAKVG
jgi:hypothetical protein